MQEIDVLIIGSGAAGLSAALKAKENGLNVVVLSKTLPTHSQTVQAQGGINAVLYEDDDTIEQHIEDTYLSSYKLAKRDNIELMCKNAKETILWLDSIGVPFNRNENKQIAQRKFGGTKKIRTCYSSDYTGLKILHALYDQCIDKGIKFYTEHQALELIVKENHCYGCIAYDIVDGKVKEFLSKTTILATGGYAGIYKNYTTNSLSTTADGISLAFKAGAKLSNIEFVQFHPTTLIDTNILISESARGEGGYLLDKNKKRFIDELSRRDEVAREIYKRIKRNEEVYLDLRHIDKEILHELIPQEIKLAYEFSNINLEEELLPITPAAHYSMGGIKTDINAKTSIENLFACGECAQSDIHGANRLGGNSLLEIVSFGKIAGEQANNTINNMDIKSINIEDNINKINEDINSLLSRDKSTLNVYNLKDTLGNLLFRKAGLFRNEEDLLSLNEDIKLIESTLNEVSIEDKSRVYNKNLVEYFEFSNSLLIGKAIALSALERKESRGSHFREDFNELKKEFEKNSILTLENNQIICIFEDLK
ncbi:FAD-dependent oxidoreductase [Arcobacter sp. YIC-464]|uniref:FAD-dependent oxidoreductase n=1 Tax=Arcobacter sp. YIC-464 TaxID=3376631 RepID=UPI003C23F36D